jgi:hypothetical protein
METFPVCITAEWSGDWGGRAFCFYLIVMLSAPDVWQGVEVGKVSETSMLNTTDCYRELRLQ